MNPELSFEVEYQKFEKSHVEDMQQLTHWIEKSYGGSLNSILDDRFLVHAIRNSASRLINFPHLILIHGFPLTMARPDIAESWLRGYFTQSPQVFKDWFNTNVSDDKNIDVKSGIIERAKRYFAQWWLHSEGGNSQPINWDLVQQSFDKLTSGQNSGLYTPFVMLFNGIQVAALEEFAQSTAPKEMFGPHTETLQ